VRLLAWKRTARAALERARRLDDEGRVDASREVLRDAVDRFPDDPDVALGYGAALWVDDPATAEVHVRRAVALAPEDPATLARAAQLLLFHEDLDMVRDLVERAGRAAPPDWVLAAQMHHMRGIVAWREGDYETAERELRAAFEAEPDFMTHGRDLAALLRLRAELQA
jgi:Flp pilus assembly protein TadD